MRIFAALVSAALVATVVAMLASTLHYGRLSLDDFRPVFLTAFATAISLGFPAFLIFRWLRWTEPWKFSLGGAVIALIPTYLLLGYPFQFSPTVADLWKATVDFWEFPVGGAFGAMIFWLIMSHQTQDSTV